MKAAEAEGTAASVKAPHQVTPVSRQTRTVRSKPDVRVSNQAGTPMIVSAIAAVWGTQRLMVRGDTKDEPHRLNLRA